MLLQNAPRARLMSATKYLCLCVLLCCSFYGSNRISDYTVAIAQWLVKEKLETISNEAPISESKYSPDICLEELKRIMNKLSQDSRCST